MLARDTRHRDGNWIIKPNSDGHLHWDGVQVAVLMDIRDELKAINRKLDCYRVPLALDALIELGVKLRREKRAARKKRRA